MTKVDTDAATTTATNDATATTAGVQFTQVFPLKELASHKRAGTKDCSTYINTIHYLQ